ncbi:hypothetical protein Scep_000717 [Stephania cephalantha]|uniref:Protein kinase domain-containing protein n=1 Tax=Stephania cephalantha TaxID=152367 RepID=A0AAP0L762_9MAGN
MSGRVPESLWVLPGLSFLDISYNNFTGVIPNVSERSNGSAAIFDLSHNQFYGNLSAQFERFSFIDLSDNYFEGRVLGDNLENVSLVRNCLRNISNQRTLEECRSFYSDKGLVFDDFGIMNETQPVVPEPARKRKRRSVYILAGVFGGLAFIVLLVVLVVCFSRTRERGNVDQEGRGVTPATVGGGESTPPVVVSLSFSNLGDSFTYDQLLRATGDFSDSNFIKHGHSGDLFKGILENGTIVVVKRIDADSIKKGSYMAELKLLSQITHNRLVPLLGHCLERENEKLLVYKLKIAIGAAEVALRMILSGLVLGSLPHCISLVSHVEPWDVDKQVTEIATIRNGTSEQGSSVGVTARLIFLNSKLLDLIFVLFHHHVVYNQNKSIIRAKKNNLEYFSRALSVVEKDLCEGEFLGFVMVKAGRGVLGRSIEELEEIVAYLESNGVRRVWMGFVVTRCPLVLSYSIDELRSRVEFYMDMGMNEKDFGTMIFEYPKALGAFTMEEMKSKVDYLKEFGLGDEDLGRLIAFKPHLMGCSIEEKWKPLVKYLYYFGVNRDGMRRMLTLKPMVFCLDLQTIIAPKVRFLQDIGIRKDAIGNMLVKFPPLLTYSLYKKIRPVVIFLMTKAGVSHRNIGKVIALGPELVGCNITHKLDPNVKYFLSLGIHLRLLGEMIADFPMLLRYNTDILRPKYRYLRRTMVRPLKDLIEFPRYFSYSLEGRIIPRHKVLVENRVNFKLRYMLASTDEEFQQRVAVAVERRRKFESGNVNDAFADSGSSDQSTETTLVDDRRLENTRPLESLSTQSL